MFVYCLSLELVQSCMIMTFKKVSILSMMFMLSACVSGGDDNVLQSAIQPDLAPTASINNNVIPTHDPLVPPVGDNSIAEQKPVINNTPSTAFASDQTPSITVIDEQAILPPPPPPRVKKTYLVNGLASSVESIGYGFTNLSKKIPKAKLYNYASFVESSTIIRARITREIKAAYAADPNIEINLIGISFGANIVTWIAQELDRKKIPINYLATLEGPAMSPIRKNVKTADNFSCTGLSCFRTSSKLAWGNTTTDFAKFKIKAGHIALADHKDVHRRILTQINQPLGRPSDVQQFIVQQ